MSSSDIPGKWQLTQSDNFDTFMSALGVGYLTRKLGNASKPLITVTEEAKGSYSIKQESLVKTTEIKFKIGEPFDETTAGGRQVGGRKKYNRAASSSFFVMFPLVIRR